jgi:hypothetical protein
VNGGCFLLAAQAKRRGPISQGAPPLSAYTWFMSAGEFLKETAELRCDRICYLRPPAIVALRTMKAHMSVTVSGSKLISMLANGADVPAVGFNTPITVLQTERCANRILNIGIPVEASRLLRTNTPTNFLSLGRGPRAAEQARYLEQLTQCR